MLRYLDVETFAQAIASGVALIYFGAIWCTPCKTISPVIEEIATENPDITVGRIDVDEYGIIAAEYDIMSIPTLLFFKDGNLMDSSVGVVGKNIVQAKLDALK
ncbi:MAG TPA: thioredoxin family protein [Candidatus Cloacimonadota bacterium]|nr:thioredoxin family protein [Candidatus Cloacimonadota bacterium]